MVLVKSNDNNLQTHKSTSYKSFLILGSIFLISLSALYVVYLTFPKLEEYFLDHLKF